MHEKYIDMIIQSDDNDKMHELKDVLIDTIDFVFKNDKNTYNKIESDLYEIAEGKVINKEKAIEWVNSMRPRGKWNYNEVENIVHKYQSSLPIVAAFVIMNMLYSEFGEIIGEDNSDETIQRYVRAAENWYYDEDTCKTEEEKLYCYKKYIVD